MDPKRHVLEPMFWAMDAPNMVLWMTMSDEMKYPTITKPIHILDGVSWNFCTDILGLRGLILLTTTDPPTFHPAPSSGYNFNLSNVFLTFPQPLLHLFLSVT